MASCHDPARYSQYEDSCAFTLIYPSPPVIVVMTYVVHVTASHNKIILSYYHDYDCLHLMWDLLYFPEKLKCSNCLLEK